MIDIKTKEELEKMHHGGEILADVLFSVMKEIKPGITELDIDRMAEERIRKRGGGSGFKKVKGYHHTICVATNDVVVHGIPTNYAFKTGDVVCIDCGVYYGGFHTDMAETVVVANADPAVKAFVKAGKEALKKAIAVAQLGNRIGHISKEIQETIEGKGYSVVRSLIGHGVGRELHEEPEVPGYLSGKIERTPLLREGMTIAIEVIYNMGKPDVVYASKDGWTIKSKDGSLSSVFERTVAITKDGPEVLTS